MSEQARGEPQEMSGHDVSIWAVRNRNNGCNPDRIEARDTVTPALLAAVANTRGQDLLLYTEPAVNEGNWNENESPGNERLQDA